MLSLCFVSKYSIKKIETNFISRERRYDFYREPIQHNSMVSLASTVTIYSSAGFDESDTNLENVPNSKDKSILHYKQKALKDSIRKNEQCFKFYTGLKV